MATSPLPPLTELRLAASVAPPSPFQLQARRRRWRGKFLQGPTSWPWLSRAGQLPGRALHVALAIRLWTGIKKSDCIVVPTATLVEMNVNRHAARRAVQALEGAGLLVVDRHVGRKTRVRVIEIDDGREREAVPDDPSAGVTTASRVSGREG